MKFKEPISVRLLAEKYNCQIEGDPDAFAHGINVIHSVEKGDITFVDIPKYFQKSINSNASIIIINESIPVPEGKTLLIINTPFDIYDDIVKSHRPFIPIEEISKTIKIHPTAIIEPQVIIKEYVTIGANTIIKGNTYIDSYTTIGQNVIVEPGCVIGSDAFYYKKHEGKYLKWTSGGETIIQDDVVISSGCTINKGVSRSTLIGAGTKIDCQVHIGHGCQLGTNCLIAAQVGISGKTKIGNNATIYGQVGIGQNLELGENIIVLGKSGVTKSLEGNKTYFGYPAGEVFQKNRELACLRRLPELLKKW